MINLEECIGKSVKDQVTGYHGICTAYAVYRTGEPRLLVEGIDSTNRPIEGWYDISRIVFE